MLSAFPLSPGNDTHLFQLPCLLVQPFELARQRLRVVRLPVPLAPIAYGPCKGGEIARGGCNVIVELVDLGLAFADDACDDGLDGCLDPVEVVVEGCGGEGELGVEAAQVGRVLVEVGEHAVAVPGCLFARKWAMDATVT